MKTIWDEGMPICNGLIGRLVWKKGDRLRISLDCSDLWDSRPSKMYQDSGLSYQWLYEHRTNGTYDEAQKKISSYSTDQYASTKLPGAALEFDTAPLGDTEQVSLYLNDTLRKIRQGRLCGLFGQDTGLLQ